MDIVESGRVVAVEEDGVWVETIRSSACGSCSARSGCGHRTLAGALTSDKGLVRVREANHLRARDCAVNDRVEISIPRTTLTRGALVLYGAPLVVASGLAGAVSQGGDAVTAAMFFFGLAATFFCLRWLDSQGYLGAHEPQLERLVDGSVEILSIATPNR